MSAVAQRMADMRARQRVAPVVVVRTCDVDGCETRLSIYNRGVFCSVHEWEGWPQ